MEEGTPGGEGGAPAPVETTDDKKIVHTYPLVKTCDMPEEMWTEVMELIVTGCEKFSSNYELASKLIKQGLDQRFGPPWNIVVGEAYGFEITYLVGSLMLMYTGGNIACICWKAP
ncbi:dynein light chain 4, axonemal, putative [Pediculus humanus corporis]|uniref:Dynein axonemal light chain 4 n=1 Tax=Pediculus humanus subsp. corporis TaxID=121224 RepID=E0VLC4_PEDHC|nr:dynein light chain 4, axonemal, putative [Pediculus humanus corporis]EEB14180.1 dynein light chain 4, axonemal, putative [Pediculus humanus corporis]